MRRWLMAAAGGSGSFILPDVPLVPPDDDSWTRSGSNPILSPSLSWEETAMQEPRVLYDGSTWRMWYTGGWTHPGMGYATSSDGITWTKYASNPVYGQGGSGYANTADCPEVVIVGSTLYLFSSGGTTTSSPFTTFRVATSTDGIAWTTQSSSITIGSGKTLWGNRTVWIEGATWYMLQEAGPTPWEIYLYTSSDGLTWSIGNGGAALTSLQVHAAGMYGGPSLYTNASAEQVPTIDGVYHVWYHAAPGTGNTPTNIYHATSADKINWTITSPSPVLTHTGSGDEFDQIADPNVVVVGSTAYIYYDAVINATQVGKIMLATAPAEVSGGGGGSCSIVGTLQDAIDATADGDTLDATGCTFSEDVTIDHPMTLLGGTINGGGTRDRWVLVTGDDVTINGLTATGAAAGAVQSAGIQVSGARFIGQSLTLSVGPYACLRLWPGAVDAQILDCDMSYGPSVGLLGFQANNAIVDGGRYHDNNAPIAIGNESGGMKFGDSTNLTVSNLEADTNMGPGVWLDVSCDGSTIDTVHAHHNTRSGIHVEITDDVLVTGCTVHRNCTENGQNAFVENGIFVSSSRNIVVTGNTVAWNNAGSPASPDPIDIAFVSQNRSPLPHNGNSATGNVLRSAVTAAAAYTDWADTGGSNTISGNTLVSDSDPLISGL